MNSENVYKLVAPYYDRVYSWVDFKSQAQSVDRIIRKHSRSGGNSLLEVACGTGRVAEALKRRYAIVATDINREMLNVAKKQVTGVTFRQADMVNLDLGKTFDAVICLGSSIGYVMTITRLRKTLSNFEKHLKQGGVLIIEPWFSKKMYKPGTPSLTTYRDNDITIARSGVGEIAGNCSVLEFHYLIASRNKKVVHCIDRHEMGLFEHATILSILKQLGLRAQYLKKWLDRDRGLFIATKS